MNNPYLVPSLDIIPLGIIYRVLGERLAYWDDKYLIETREPFEGFEVAPDKFPNGELIDTSGCIIEWVESTDAEARQNIEDAAVESYRAALKEQLGAVEDIRAVTVDEMMAQTVAAIGAKGTPIKAGG